MPVLKDLIRIPAIYCYASFFIVLRLFWPITFLILPLHFSKYLYLIEFLPNSPVLNNLGSNFFKFNSICNFPEAIASRIGQYNFPVTFLPSELKKLTVKIQ